MPSSSMCAIPTATGSSCSRPTTSPSIPTTSRSAGPCAIRSGRRCGATRRRNRGSRRARCFRAYRCASRGWPPARSWRAEKCGKLPTAVGALPSRPAHETFRPVPCCHGTWSSIGTGRFMTDQSTIAPGVAVHGATRLPTVDVDSYNAELKDYEGFLGDRANKAAFRRIIENWRKPLRKAGDDPFGDEPSEELNRKRLDALMCEGDPEAAGVVQGAIEDFSQELALVIRRFLKLKAWRDTERIVVGGGFRASRVGELTIGRTAVILKAEKVAIDLVPIHHDPDEAGLIGAAHLAPRWMFAAPDPLPA